MSTPSINHHGHGSPPSLRLHRAEAEHTAWMCRFHSLDQGREGGKRQRTESPGIVEHEVRCLRVEPFKFPWAIEGPFSPVAIPVCRLTPHAVNRPACPLAFPQPRIGEQCPGEVGLNEIGETEVDPDKDRLAEVCLAQVCPPQVCLVEVCVAEDCLPEVCVAEDCPSEVHIAQVCLREGRSAEGCPPKVYPDFRMLVSPGIPCTHIVLQPLQGIPICHVVPLACASC